jgi:hypothetical protein
VAGEAFAPLMLMDLPEVQSPSLSCAQGDSKNGGASGLLCFHGHGYFLMLARGRAESGVSALSGCGMIIPDLT